jgi:hypothetical protein
MVSHFRQVPADERVLRLQIDPPEGGRFTIGNNVGGIALSPDGRTAAFVASANGKNGLWVRPLDSMAARLLPGTEGAAYPSLVARQQIHRLPCSRQAAARGLSGRIAAGDLRSDCGPRRRVVERRPNRI